MPPQTAGTGHHAADAQRAAQPQARLIDATADDARIVKAGVAQQARCLAPYRGFAGLAQGGDRLDEHFAIIHKQLQPCGFRHGPRLFHGAAHQRDVAQGHSVPLAGISQGHGSREVAQHVSGHNLSGMGMGRHGGDGGNVAGDT